MERIGELLNPSGQKVTPSRVTLHAFCKVFLQLSDTSQEQIWNGGDTMDSTAVGI